VKSKNTWIALAGVMAVLLGAVALQWINVRDFKEGDRHIPARPVNLAAALPAQLAGWQGRDEPLGPNETVTNAVERTLNYDDFVNRVFSKNGTTLGIYVAYWTAGRMPLQKVASHTPDRCWTENGWHCAAMRQGENVAAGAVRLRAAQWRLFHPPGQPDRNEYVLYWHLVGTQLYDYGDRFNARPDLVKWWRDTLAYATAGSEAQYFIRVTSNEPFEKLAGDAGWEQLLAALGKLGLGVAPKAPRPET